MNKELYRWATSINENLVNTDFAFTIYVEHEDGTVMCLQNAMYIMFEDDWFVVFTEHCGFFVLHKEDLLYFCVDDKFDEDRTYFVIDKRPS